MERPMSTAGQSLCAVANDEFWQRVQSHPRSLSFAEVRLDATTRPISMAVYVEQAVARGVPFHEAVRDLLERERCGELKLAFAADPGGAASDYVATIERLWPTQREHFDFVGAATVNAKLQAFKRDIYLSHLTEVLAAVPVDATVLDAGCGVGRFASSWHRRRWRVVYVDASMCALCAAARAALSAGADWNHVAFVQARLDDLSGFADASFDVVFAFESVCYLAEPNVGLAELARVAKPGANVIVSFEGAWGAIAASERIGAADVDAVLAGNLCQPGELAVTYTDREHLVQYLEDVGLEIEFVTGTHYVADGVLGRLAATADLTDAVVRRQLLALDRRCAKEPAIRDAARGWLAVTRKPHRKNAA